MIQHPPLVTDPSHWLMGPAWHARRDPLHWIPAWAEEYGDVYSISSRLGSVTVVAHPDLARQVLAERYRKYPEKGRSYAVLRLLMGNGLVTSSGEFWRGQRKLTQPAFHRRRLDAIFAMMVERSRAYADRLPGKGEAHDMVPFFSQLTLEIISRAMFSTDVQTLAAEVSGHILELNEAALRILRQPWRFLLPRRFPTPLTKREFHARKAMDEIVRGIISRRRASGESHDDLLGMFLSACDEETGKGMTDEQLRDEVMTIFVAGHETTANAMCWVLHLLSTHEEIAGQVHAEIDSAGDALDRCDLSAFPLLKRVIEESLRLFPTIWTVGRRCGEDDELGGMRIPQGTTLLVPIFYFHSSSRWWDRSEVFDPDRFLPDRRPSPEIYMPFGAGPRTCIGNHFAMQELIIMTAVFLRSFRVLPQPGFKVERDPLITLRPKHGMQLRFERR